MMVHPTIDTQTGKITMNIRPTISRVIDQKEDPAVAILSKQTKTSTVPEVQVREMDSILQVESGGIVIMGGLMEERSDNETTGLPGAQDVPLFGNLFQAKNSERQISELVIFLRATIIEDEEESITPADERVYKTFGKDSRPLGLGE